MFVRALGLRFQPTINWLRWLIAPAMAFMVACLDRGYQTDFWHHLARGREIVTRGYIVNHDLFTFTIAGQPIQDANWVTQVIYFRLFTWGGISLVQLVNAAILAAALLVLVRNCRRMSGSLPASAAVGVVAFLGIWPLILIRPQSFSFLLFVLLYWVLTELPRTKALVLVPPVMMALWANLHGGFAIGLVLIAAFAGSALATAVVSNLKSISGSQRREEKQRPLKRNQRGIANQEEFAPFIYYLTTLFLSALATLANPYGWRVYQYVGVVASRAAGRHIEEWLPPSPATWLGQAFFLSIIALLILFWLCKRWPTILEIVLLLLFLPVACGSVRMVAWWWLATAPILATLLAEKFAADSQQPARPPQPSWTAALLLSAVVTVCVLSIPQLEAWNPLFRGLRTSHRVESDLQAATAPLQHGRIFARLEWGEYLDWQIGPAQRLFIDGRIEAYSEEIWRDYCQVSSSAPGWDQVLTRWNADDLLLDRTYHQKLIAAVRASGFWREAASNGPAVAFIRRKQAGVAAVDNPDF